MGLIERKKIQCILLGIPQVPVGESYHPGGQLTAANGLVEFLDREGIKHKILNTVARVFPPVPLWKKFLQSVGRVALAWFLVAKGEVKGYVAFSGFGLSLYERCGIALICRLHKKPSVIFFRSTEIIGKSMSRFRRRLLSLVLDIPTTVVSQSSLLAGELQGIGLRSVVVIPNWLPAGYTISERPKSYPLDGIVNFVFVGWLERTKGVPELIEAAAKLQYLSSRFQLYLVGSGSLAENVSEAIVSRRLENVHALGWMEHSKVIDVLDAAHVLVLPSHSEGFPNALLEAMSQGLPVISTRVGGIPDCITHDLNGMLVEMHNADDIALSMCRYIEDSSLIPEHSKQAIKRVLDFHDRDENCMRLINLLDIQRN
jgi:glycosyltransferase involved in cell wall biosynthesis